MIMIKDGIYHEVDCTPEEFTLTTWPVKGWVEYTGIWPIPVPETVYTPQSLSRKQAKLVLLKYGLLDGIEAFVATQSREVQIVYADAATFERDNELLNFVAEQKGIKDQLDQM